MRILNLILFCLTCFHICTAQRILNETDSVTVIAKNKLYEKGITKYFSVKNYCIGGVGLNPKYTFNCIPKGEYYFTTHLFWKEDEKYWIKRVDNCGEFQKIEIKNSEPYQLFAENLKDLQSKKVKRYEVENQKDSTKKLFVTRSHSCFKRFKFHINDTIIKSHFDVFDISSDGKETNLNYDYNNALKVVVLSKIIDDLLSKLEVESRFIRSN